MSVAARLRIGLRARATVGFGLTALLVAVSLAAVTYGLARRYLVKQREDTAIHQSYVNARLARSVLRSPNADVRGLLTGLGGATASNTVLQYQGEWFGTSVAVGRDDIPPDLIRLVSEGDVAHQRYRDAEGNLHLAIGVPVPGVDSFYFEIFALAELERTLALLSRALGFGVAGAAVVAAVVGRAAAGRLVRPLRPVADAAERIAGGALDTRLSDATDPDIRRLADAFNSMAAALESRIQREARFAADVSHELRSPLAAVAAALEIIERRKGQLPAAIVEAWTVLSEKVKTFQQMVLDLLEISRMDAGTAVLSVDLIDLDNFLTRLLALHGTDAADVVFETRTPTIIEGDRRRLAQAFGNIMDNALRYAGGVTRVIVEPTDSNRVRIAFEDKGPGVTTEERSTIFGRFARGDAGISTGSTTGTGLGLALVAEHVRLHAGDVWVEEAATGGARFVVELPVTQNV